MVPRSAAGRRLRPGIALAFLAVAVVLIVGDGTPAASGRQGEPRAPRGFVELREVDSSILQEIRYATSYNFVGKSIDGYREPVCLLTRDAAEALHRAQGALRKRGYGLKVYDCYRPRRAVKHFLRWADEPGGERMKKAFFPRIAKDRLFDEGFLAERSEHSRGSTVDITLVRLPAHTRPPRAPDDRQVPCYAPRPKRPSDGSVDMGTSFDCFDDLSHTNDPRVGHPQRERRLLLATALRREGFTGIPAEWWHFTLRSKPFADESFDFPVERGTLAAR